VSGQLSLAGIRSGAMEPPAGGAADYEQMLMAQFEQAARDERALRMQPLQDALARVVDRSGALNVGSMMLPQDAGEAALGAAMVPGPMGLGLRTALAALGGLTTAPGDAEGALLVRARRALESGVMGRHGTRELEEMTTRYPRVADVQEPTVQAYLNQMRNVLETPGPQMRVFEDPIDFLQGNREPEWMLALNPQRDSLTPFGHRTMSESRFWAPGDEFNTMVGNVLADNRIMRMYPGLEDVAVRFEGDRGNVLGSYMPNATGWSGEPSRISLYGHHVMDSANYRRGTWAEELQHTIQDLDGRGATNADWETILRTAAPEEVVAMTQRFGDSPQSPLTHRMYRAQPHEWEGGLVAQRAMSRQALPSRFADIEYQGPEAYWNLFEPNFWSPRP
jgi:hypothetical protein